MTAQPISQTRPVESEAGTALSLVPNPLASMVATYDSYALGGPKEQNPKCHIYFHGLVDKPGDTRAVVSFVKNFFKEKGIPHRKLSVSHAPHQHLHETSVSFTLPKRFKEAAKNALSELDTTFAPHVSARAGHAILKKAAEANLPRIAP